MNQNNEISIGRDIITADKINEYEGTIIVSFKDKSFTSPFSFDGITMSELEKKCAELANSYAETNVIARWLHRYGMIFITIGFTPQYATGKKDNWTINISWKKKENIEEISIQE